MSYSDDIYNWMHQVFNFLSGQKLWCSLYTGVAYRNSFVEKVNKNVCKINENVNNEEKNTKIL